MKRLFRWKALRGVLLGLLVMFAGIQLVPVDRTNPPVETDVPVAANVRAVLRRARYDRHSFETVWPRYGTVAPVSWLVASDTRDGRKELNFSTWNRYTPEQQVEKLRECSEQVSKGEMPLWVYLPTHRDAVLTAEDEALLRDWATGTSHKPTRSGGD